jgi:hypothetical protein
MILTKGSDEYADEYDRITIVDVSLEVLGEVV